MVSYLTFNLLAILTDQRMEKSVNGNSNKPELFQHLLSKTKQRTKGFEMTNNIGFEVELR